MAYFGNARIDENGNITGGRAGDQGGREVCIQEAYTFSWISVFRPKFNAELVAKLMKQACENDNIGYDQGQRMTLKQAWIACGKPKDLSVINVPCECDCSSLVGLILHIAGLVPESATSFATSGMADVIRATGNFIEYSGAGYTTGFGSIREGDVMYKVGHTAIATSGLKAQTSAPAAVQSYDAQIFVRIHKEGKKILWLAAWTSVGNLYVQVATKNGWLDQLTNPRNLDDTENGCCGDGSPITKVKMVYDSPDGQKSVFYRVRSGDTWYSWLEDNYELTDQMQHLQGGDDFAGDGEAAIEQLDCYIGSATY